MAKYILRYLFLSGVSALVSCVNFIVKQSRGLRIAALIACLFGLTTISCKKFKTKIDTPAYISISSYDVVYTATYSNGGPGTTNHKFTDVSVTINGDVYGVFPLPCKIPVTKSGNVSVKIRPVIKVNGVSGVRSEYAPMKSFDATVAIESGKITELKPTFDYYPSGVTFYWVEDFEFTGSSLIGDTAIKLQSVDKFEGTRAVKIELRNGQTTCLAHSSTMFALPTGSEAVYLEVNYKCNQPFNIGLLDVNKNPVGGGSAGGANPSNDWNKIYFFLTPVTGRNPLPAYYVYFYFNNAAFDPNNSIGGNPTLLIDNIKVVSQP